MNDRHALHTKAMMLRSRLDVDYKSPVDIFSLALSIPNLTLVFYPFTSHISGMCIKNDGCPVIAINSSVSLGRMRFSLAHEFYHLFHDESEHTVSSEEIGRGNPIERVADRFASYFLMPSVALTEMVEKLKSASGGRFGLREIVKLEQYFQVSRQALLVRLLEENFINNNEAEQYRQRVIASASHLGYDDSLYNPLPEEKRYKAYGYYVRLAEELFQKELISIGKYEELLLSGFRPDLVYGTEEAELID